MHYFILGPSGSGKSYVAERFAASIRALWLEADRVFEDGINALGLRTEWDAFANLKAYEPICDEFDRRAKAEKKESVVLSLPGFPILTMAHAELARSRARIAYLSGTPGQCLDSFLRREKATGRNLDLGHWCRNTGDFFTRLECPEFKPLVITNFNADGSYRALEEVFSDVTSTNKTIFTAL
jgi:shikimate kinase